MEKSPKEIFWDRMLEVSGHGTTVVGVRAGELMDNAEEAAFAAIYTELSGVIGINDCFLDFYLSSLEEVANEINRTRQRLEPRDFLAFSHMEALHRFRAAHLLMQRGHYTEAIDLCRGIWETVLAVIAVARGIVSVEELFGGKGPRDREMDDQERRTIIQLAMAADSKIQNSLLWNSPTLSESAKEHIRGMVRIMHTAVHKSRLSLLYILQTWYDGTNPIPLLPQFDMKFAQVCGNILLFNAWCLARTLRFFNFLFEPRDEIVSWQNTFEKMDKLLADVVKGTPAPKARGIEEFVRVHLSFGEASG